MKENFKLVRIDNKYCDYLRKYDSKAMYNSNSKLLRPFVGVLFTVNKYKYFAPLSSPKPKHVKMKNKIEYINLDEKTSDIYEDKYNKMLKSQVFWLNRYGRDLTKKAKALYDKYTKNILAHNIQIRCCNYKLLEEKCEEYNKL